jgi:hypothetical protein
MDKSNHHFRIEAMATQEGIPGDHQVGGAGVVDTAMGTCIQ